MKKIFSVIVIALMLVGLASVQTSKASYVSLSMDELISQSEVILIGEIIGPVGERKDWSQGLNGTWTTYWKVKVFYYLKGNQTAQEFIVATPGAQNKLVMTSIDYRLDRWGKTALLFIRQRDTRFEPISPQGVVALDKRGFNQSPSEATNGQQILKEFTITDPNMKDPKVLEKLILENSSILIPTSGTAGNDLSGFNSTSLILISAATILLALILFGLWLVKKHQSK